MNATTKTKFPPFLKNGETIGLVAPAGPVIKEEEFAAGVHLLKEMGFEVKYQRDILRREGYLAGSDKARLDEMYDMWRDPQVKALLAVRGGYGSLRLMEHFDFDLMRQQAKMFIGFSDLTVLLNSISQSCGLVTFHGPMLTTLAKSDSETQAAFFDLLAGRHGNKVKFKGVEILQGGSSQGHLIGGNLTNLAHLIGTPYEPQWQNAILLLEDIGEAPYRIDRLLTHLRASGKLRELNGILLGSFSDCGEPEHIWQRTLELAAEYDYPIWARLPVGHGKQNIPLPLGGTVQLDSSSGLLNLGWG